VTAGPGADGEVIRALVREVLAELLPAAATSEAGSAGPGERPPGTPRGADGAWTASRQATSRDAQVGSGQGGFAGVGPAQQGLAHPVTEHVESVEVVSLRTDAELAAFVMRLLHLFENPKHRDALRTGRLRFRLPAAAVPGSVQPSHRVDKGAVTEAMVTAAARAGARLVLGPRAVLTPLGRDRARAAGVEIVKER
jgi:hypothetical protein